MVGNTTRAVDNAIQELFTKGKVVATDHYDIRQAHREVYHRIIKRLEAEHPRVPYNRYIDDLTITLRTDD